MSAELLDRVVVERASPPPRTIERLAILAHWSPSAGVSRSAETLVNELVGSGYYVVMVSSAEVPEPLDFRLVRGDNLVVLRKPNIGYDFGSWAVGLHWAARWLDAATVVLCNDSLVGPFRSLAPVLSRVDESGADLVGLTDNTQFRPHLQSYFVAYRRGILRDPALQIFWSRVRHHADKQQIIHAGELGLAALCATEGYAVEALFPASRVVGWSQNPTILGWQGLIDQGFPFVKREIVRHPELAPAGDRIPAVVRERFGVTIEEWL